MTQGLQRCGALVLIVLVSASVAGLAACSREAAPLAAQAAAPFVRTVAPRTAGGDSLLLSGTVRARQETPLAFQIGGRIASRHADAGDAVSAGQLLFRIDPRDLAAAAQAAAADEAAARAALATGAGRVFVNLLDAAGPGVDPQHPELMFRGAAWRGDAAARSTVVRSISTGVV